MRSRNYLTLIVVVLLVLGLSHESKTTSRVTPVGPPPDQVTSLTATRTDTTVSTAFVNVPAGLTFTTTQHRAVMVQFFTSARLTVPGEYLELRAVVDGVPVNPPMRYTGTELSSMAYSGVLAGVPPGFHTVFVQWRVTGGGAIMENRTFTAWIIP